MTGEAAADKLNDKFPGVIAERTAFRIVQAICANDIPNVRLEF